MKEPFIDLEGNPGEMEVATWQVAITFPDNEAKCQGDKLVDILTILSGRHVSIGTKDFYLYAYFDEEQEARKAASVVPFIATCEVEVRSGSFNVTSLTIVPGE